MPRLITALTLPLLLCFAAIAQDKVTIDRLTRQLVKEREDTVKVNLLNDIAHEYRKSNLQFTDSFAQLAIDLGNKLDFHKGIGQGYINKALVNRNAGDYEMALQNSRWAMVHFIEANYLPGYASAYNTIANIHYVQGNYSKAMLYYFNSLSYSEMIHDSKGEAITLNNIGAVYMESRAYEKALVYYEKAYAILNELKDEDGMADCRINIGSIYHYQKNMRMAIANYEDALRINKMLGDKRDISASLNNIGLAYYESGDYKSALDNYHQSLMIDEAMGDINAIVVSYGNIANCYFKLKMYHAAHRYASESLNLAKAFKLRTDIMDAYEILYQVEVEKKDFQSALAYHQLYKAYSDSISFNASNERISLLEDQYLKEKSEKEAMLKSKQHELNAIIFQEKEKHISQYIFIIGMVLSLFVLLIYVVFFILRKAKPNT